MREEKQIYILWPGITQKIQTFEFTVSLGMTSAVSAHTDWRRERYELSITWQTYTYHLSISYVQRIDKLLRFQYL